MKEPGISNRERKQSDFMSNPTKRQMKEHRRLKNSERRLAKWTPVVADMRKTNRAG